jgi:hypothetical protein
MRTTLYLGVTERKGGKVELFKESEEPNHKLNHFQTEQENEDVNQTAVVRNSLLTKLWVLKTSLLAKPNNKIEVQTELNVTNDSLIKENFHYAMPEYLTFWEDLKLLVVWDLKRRISGQHLLKDSY